MAFIDEVLQQPSYGWMDDQGLLIKPTLRQLYAEAFSRINIFKSKKNWISLFSWVMAACMFPFFLFFLIDFISWKLVIVVAVYAMIIMSTHGTIWFHRFCTHRSYRFSRSIWRIITQNLVIRTFPEELYVISHHVHHVKSDLPGDPYNPKGGFMYVMLADINHQSISRDLSQEKYERIRHFLDHTGVALNSYKGYLAWGSVSRPAYVISLLLLNWTAWYFILYFIGGNGLVCACFSGAFLWQMLVRAFNYTGHGKGENKQVEGIDFDKSNLSINQTRPGLFSGEWHNNHHLFPGSARAGFLPYQLDLAWIYIYCLFKLRMVSSYKDSKKEFLKKYYAKIPMRDEMASLDAALKN
jgi:sn-1 stearoyl-lipid 9-desaturase